MVEKKNFYWKMILNRYRRNFLVIFAALIIISLFIMGALAPQIATHSPTRQNYRKILEPPSRENWFGTDELGRDIFSRVVYGARLSFTIGILSVALGAFIGVSIGFFAGYYGGALDMIVGRLIDILLSFPGILIAMLIAVALGASMYSVIVAVAVYSVPTFARLARSAALSIKKRDYVLAARAIGAKEKRIILKHVLLNSFGPILVYSTLLLGSAILTAAALSFLGVGVPPPASEWGAMINTGRSHMRSAPHVVIFPGMAIFLTVLSFNIIGDVLRDVFDPKSIRPT